MQTHTMYTTEGVCTNVDQNLIADQHNTSGLNICNMGKKHWTQNGSISF